MQFSLGNQFSREFSFEDGRITSKLAVELNLFFAEKNYGKRIDKIYAGFICVSIGFEPFFPIRPLKVMKKEPALEYEIKLDYESFKSSDEPQRKSLMVGEFFKRTKECLQEKTITGFEKERFIIDLESYFKEHGYL